MFKFDLLPSTEMHGSTPAHDSVLLVVPHAKYSGVLVVLQSYKEKCRQIEYDCNTDTISAECGNGEEGAAFAWIQDSLPAVSYCIGYGDISTKHGYLVCAL